MGAVLSLTYYPGKSIDAYIQNDAGQYWNETGDETAAFEAFNSAHRGNYAQAMAPIEVGSDEYQVAFPAGITATGVYRILYRNRLGTDAAASDTPLGDEQFIGSAAGRSLPTSVSVAPDECDIYVTVRGNGEWAEGVLVTLESAAAPNVSSGSVIRSARESKRTDSSGRVDFVRARGISVRARVPDAGVDETFTVPDQAEYNLALSIT